MLLEYCCLSYTNIPTPCDIPTPMSKINGTHSIVVACTSIDPSSPRSCGFNELNTIERTNRDIDMGCMPSRPKGLPRIFNSNADLMTTARPWFSHRKTYPATACFGGHGILPVGLSAQDHERSPSILKPSKSTTSSCALSQSSTLRGSPPSDRAPTPPPKDILLDKKCFDSLTGQQRDITHLINGLTSQLREYVFSSSHNRTQTLADLDEIVSCLPSSSTKIRLIHLRASVAQKFGNSTNLGETIPVLSELWDEFLAQSRQQQRAIAKRLYPTSQPMLMFDLLKYLQNCCEHESTCDKEAQGRIQGVFEDVLRELSCAEGKEWGSGLGGHACMKWRVFGLIARGRVEKLSLGVEEIRMERMEVSRSLLEFLEGLGEA